MEIEAHILAIKVSHFSCNAKVFKLTIGVWCTKRQMIPLLSEILWRVYINIALLKASVSICFRGVYHKHVLGKQSETPNKNFYTSQPNTILYCIYHYHKPVVDNHQFKECYCAKRVTLGKTSIYPASHILLVISTVTVVYHSFVGCCWSYLASRH